MREKIARVKRFAVAAVVLPAFALLFVNTAAVGMRASDEDVAAAYKARCAVCHGGKAERFFEPAKADESHAEAVMKGVRPRMPGYEARGMTAEQTKALVEHMRALRQQPQQ
ncbi:MAG TPA: cytochrome c [Pyrinomonadaceae bacterium]|nr:cytochrome c [Pyrinomonadaceae bacterium]